MASPVNVSAKISVGFEDHFKFKRLTGLCAEMIFKNICWF